MAFDDKSNKQIRDTVKRVEREYRSKPIERARPPVGTSGGAQYAVTNEEIDSTSQGNVTLQTVSSDGTYTATTNVVLATNNRDVGISGGALVVIIRIQSIWDIVDIKSCSNVVLGD